MWTQAQIWSHGTSRHLQVVPWCSGWSHPCHFPLLPPHPSSSIRSCQPDRQLYSEATPPSSSLSSGALITLLLSHVTAPFRGPRFIKQTLACVFLLPRVQPPATQPRLWDTEPSAGLRVRDPALQPWHCPHLPCGSTSLHRPAPAAPPLCSQLCQAPRCWGAGQASCRPPCLFMPPFVRTSTPSSWATHGVSPGYARLPTALRAPQSQGPCLPAVMSWSHYCPR